MGSRKLDKTRFGVTLLEQEAWRAMERFFYKTARDWDDMVLVYRGFQSSGNFNKKSDVYSFGIILFELIAGRIAIVRGLVKNNHILDWVNPLIERGDVQNIIDPRLEGEFDSTSTWKAIEIAMSCIPSYAIQRLDMSYVLAEPKECLALEMAHERTQRMATEGNLTTSSIPYKMTHLKYESDIVPQSR
ncbi:receptor-like protein kinase At3g21340 [Quercus suber]|uniref:receptor-like protein kinase At3g21340 n=1 Tax=Quercus suber TaxID=58331 RepID=UPI0032E02D82